ncbi:MAG: sigma-54-dependent Fis family transcriptional regulator, partial [Anaerolineaceae bacterium]|nr:sigma-54-dependent Fis family transcriptional regulator [Anaerolineaceae bacterium]
MSATILVVDDVNTAREAMANSLRKDGYEVLEASTLSEARAALEQNQADICVLDIKLPDGNGLQLMDDVALQSWQPKFIVITAYGEIDIAVDAMKKGAVDFLTKPLNMKTLKQSISRASEIVAMRRELNHLRSAQTSSFVMGKSQRMKALYDLAQRAADTSVSILITGESGTGKEVMANFIHQAGPRQQKPFIAVNSAAIANTMMESELFGHEANAFTGAANKRKLGLMEVADTGILFLDEISTMPIDMQAKLLRAIEERAFRRVGGTTLIRVDVQIIAASNRNLKEAIKAGEFREDLYYRLKVVDLDIPPLRKRPEDIPELVGLLMRQTNMSMGTNVQEITPRAMEALLAYDWPGNIRELRHLLERAIVFCDEPVIDLKHLPA